MSRMGAPDGWYAVQDDGPHPTGPEEEERMTTQRDDAGQDFLRKLLATEVWADDSGTFPIRTGKLRAILSALDVERQQVSVQARARRLAEAECASLKARLEHEGALVEKWRIEVVALRRDLAEDEPDNSADDPQHSLGENPMTTQRDDAGQRYTKVQAIAQMTLARERVAVLESALAAQDEEVERLKAELSRLHRYQGLAGQRADEAEAERDALKQKLTEREQRVRQLEHGYDVPKSAVEERDEWWRAWAWQLFDAAGGTVSAMYFFNAFDARRASEEPSHE